LFAILVQLLQLRLHYYDYFNITDYTALFRCAFQHLLGSSSSTSINSVVLFNVSVFQKNLYLDAGLSQKHDVAKTEDLVWLNLELLVPFLK
jgi:hypothetical protein